MKLKTFLQISSLIFLAVAILHGLRLLNGWSLNIGGYEAPLWLSWIGLVVAAFLSYTSMKYANKK